MQNYLAKVAHIRRTTMATTFNQSGDVLTVIPEGRIDTITSPVLEKEIQQHLDGIVNIIMDFKNINYISSGGIRVLLAFQQEMMERDGDLKLTNVSDNVYDIFDLVGFADMIEIT